MSGFDEQGVFYTDQNLGVVSENASVGGRSTDTALAPARIQGRFRQFLKEWTHKETHIYVESLRANYSRGQYFVEVNMAHLLQFDEELGGLLREQPTKYLELFEDAAKEVLDFTTNKKDLNDIQVHLTGFDRMSSLRGLGATDISKLVNIPGIIISTARTRSKVQKMTIMCRNCNDTKVIYSRPGFGNLTPPRRCSASPMDVSGEGTNCPLDPYVVLTEHCTFVDTQSMKVQERPEMVPTGDMPRHLTCNVERFLVSRVKPGSRVKLTGVYGVMPFSLKRRDAAGSGAKTKRMPYLRVVGIQAENEGAVTFTPEDEEEMHELARTPNLYAKISKSIAPLIWGHEDIKKAVACLMFGGSRKTLPDGMRLRGDINVLLLGDPSVAKSQFLKFAEQVAPIAVYTSGKGSSAAGLTASVIRDPSTREFHLEGGALVLADGGVVCIDEFDKMREQDRVAIHEAMEQQTISIAKAGITTILNSRTSVLAAANPIYGRYDTERTASENISLQSTILSRFDMIFVIIDKHDADQDARLSKHVINIHKNNAMLVDDEDVFSTETLKKYIAFCRQNCNPRLSADAAETLRNHYVNIRSQVAKSKKDHNDAPIPITVRQLEAITRISESLARIELMNHANSAHVAEAIRLFKFSTVQAASSGSIAQGSGSSEFRKAVQCAEDFIRARIPISHRISRTSLLDQYLVALKTDSVPPFRRALEIMNSRGDIQLENQNRTVRRQR